MIISLPNDGRGLLYHILDLTGNTVHAYRDLDAALRAREGDQRIAILQEPIGGRENRWLTGPPAPDRDVVREQAVGELRKMAEADEALAVTHADNMPGFAKACRDSAAGYRATIAKLEAE